MSTADKFMDDFKDELHDEELPFVMRRFVEDCGDYVILHVQDIRPKSNVLHRVKNLKSSIDKWNDLIGKVKVSKEKVYEEELAKAKQALKDKKALIDKELGMSKDELSNKLYDERINFLKKLEDDLQSFDEVKKSLRKYVSEEFEKQKQEIISRRGVEEEELKVWSDIN